MTEAPVTISPKQVFKAIGYSPHYGQRAFHRSECRNKVLAGGRRGGKSECGAHELDLEAQKTGLMRTELEDRGIRREFWIVGPNYSDSEKEFRKHYNALKKIGAPFDKPGTYYSAHGGDMQISMFGGLYMVKGMSAAHPESLVGEGLSGVIMAEAAKQNESTWSKYIRPTLADFKGWSIHTSTPEGKNWFYDLWMDGNDPTNPNWDSWRFPAWTNPYVYPMGATQAKINTLRAALEDGGFDWERLVDRIGIDPEIAALVRDLNDETFNQEIGADFNEFAGRVFKDWDDEIHVDTFEFNPAWKTYGAADFGFTNPFVWLIIQVDPFDNVYVYDEMYEPGLTIDEAAVEMAARGLAPRQLHDFYPDPASPGDSRALERHFPWMRSQGGTGGELETRLRYIRAALKVRNPHLPWGDPERKPKLKVNRRCRNTIREMGIYKYPKKRDDSNAPEKPEKKNDHTPETLGRFYAGHYGAPESGSGHARVSGSRMG